ncbi:hypothetical protein ACIQ2D_09575 [Lysinibacillus sp. NPDC097287]|uniref:hypothetical protein n=1 Tax=Lysinibacillus sp. NPDC097287 TaxID=3364144 RepID=UPI0037F92FB1
MKKVLTIVLGALIVIGGWLLYQFYSDSEAIKKSVMASDGYRSTIGEEYRAVKFFVKPDWYDLDTQKLQNVNKVVAQVGNSKIVLKEVSVRDEVKDVYFTFVVENKLSRNSGYFLTQNLTNSTDELAMPTIELLTVDDQEIALGQFGQGPDEYFSFGINLEDVDEIKNGFSVVASIYYGVQYDKN